MAYFSKKLHSIDWAIVSAKATFLGSGALLFVIMGLLYYIAFYENPPIEFYNAPFPTEKEVYQPGEIVVISVEGYRYTNKPFVVSYQLQGDKFDTLPEQERSGHGKGPVPLTRIGLTTLPVDATAGPHIICAKATYDFGIFNRVVSWCTQQFFISERSMSYKMVAR